MNDHSISKLIEGSSIQDIINRSEESEPLSIVNRAKEEWDRVCNLYGIGDALQGYEAPHLIQGLSKQELQTLLNIIYRHIDSTTTIQRDMTIIRLIRSKLEDTLKEMGAPVPSIVDDLNEIDKLAE